MTSRTIVPRLLVMAGLLILLGLLGAYWPRWVGAALGPSASAPNATIEDAITYQGYLTDETGMPLSGTYTMQFQIYNAAESGDLLWEGSEAEIMVEDGLFATKLLIATDIFNGEELWVAQTVEGELLSPRQQILPAPMAHTLRPGAIVKGTANAVPNNYLLEVHMVNDVFAFNRGAITGQTTTGNAIHGFAPNGRAVYGQTEDGYAVYGFDGGSSANNGYAGFFYSTNGVGVYGYSGADRSHPNILAPGVYGQSNQGVGVYGRGDTSDGFTFYNEGGFFEGGKGLFARGTDPATQQGWGARIFSDAYRGAYMRGGDGHYDAYFGGSGGINTNGIVDRSARTQSLVVNLGGGAIAPGDLVAMVGVNPSPETGEAMLAVAAVDGENRDALIGVAMEAVAVQTLTLEDGSSAVDFMPRAGPIEAGDYLVIATAGLVPAVNLSSLGDDLPAAEWTIGAKIVLSENGSLARMDGSDGGLVVGRVAGRADSESGTVPLFLDIE